MVFAKVSYPSLWGRRMRIVALLDLYAIRLGTWLSEPLVVVVYGDREIALGLILADDIAVKELFYLTWFGGDP